MRAVGLFAGIGGLELGIGQAGHSTELLVENAPAAAHVLRTRFQDVKIESDVRFLKRLPDDVDLVMAGFPCQDLSSVGRKMGIEGTKSSLIGEVVRLLKTTPTPWLLLENVPFLLSLDGGRALQLVTSALTELGYRWAYRVVDSNAFGLPQRRNRWYLVASQTEDPRNVLLVDDAKKPEPPADYRDFACGFYWTEGMRALGWAVDSVPPIKCGSSVGVASPPAIRLPSGDFITPEIRDAERLQGFPPDWTFPAEEVARLGERWRMVGNAVSVPVAAWLGRQLANPGVYAFQDDQIMQHGHRWPRKAAWADHDGVVHASNVGPWPEWLPRTPLHEFLKFPHKPLSIRAATGFLRRTAKGSLRFPEGFLTDLEAHVLRQQIS